MNKIIAGLLGPLLLGACTTLQAPDTELPWDPQVVRGQLPNGLEYRLVRDTSQKNRLDLRLTVQAGSVDEDDDQVGVAHMVEHLTFHAHGGQPQDLRARMTALGWVQGRHFNAVTNYDRTQYMLSPPSGVKQAPEALAALNDLVFARDYSAADLARERPIVIEEWRGGLGVAQRMNEQRTASQRVGSRYPQHRTIGNETAIREASLASLKRFQDRWYVPNNMVLSVVGDFEPQALAAEIGKAFASARRAALPERGQRELPLSPTLKVFRLQDPQSGSNQVAILFRAHEPDSRGTTRAAFREKLIERMTLSAMVASLRSQPRPEGVRSMVSQRTLIGLHSTVTGIAAGVDDHDHALALRFLLTEIERLRQHGFTADDLAREQANIRRLGAKTLSKNDARTFENWVEQLNTAVAQDKSVVARHAAAGRYLEVLDDISLDDLNARLRRWLDSPDQVLQISAPGTSPLEVPSVAEVEQLRATISQSSLAAPVKTATPGRAVAAAPLKLPAPAAAGDIVARKVFEAENVEHWQLGNGDKLVWLRRNAEDGRWSLQAESSAGFNQTIAPAWRLQMAAQLASQSGPAGSTVESLKDWRLRHQAQLSLEQTARRLQITLNTHQGTSLADMLQSYRLSQVGNVLPADLFSEARDELRKRQETRPDDVRSREDATLRELMYGSDRWKAPQPAELVALQAATLEQDWQRLVQAPVTYYLMADAKPQTVEAAVRAHLANIPRGSALEPQPSLQQPGQRRADLAIALEPRAVLQATSFSEHPWSPQAAARVASLRELANRRLKERLRGEASGVYRLKFDTELNPETQRIESRLSFTCDPQRVDELWAMAQETLASLPQAVDDQWVQGERATLLRQERLRRDDPTTQFRRLILSERQWQDPRYLRTQVQLPEALQAKPLKALASELFPRGNQVQLRLLPTPEAQAQAL